MGGLLTPLACDNCTPGDASGWYLPLGLLFVVCVALAVLVLTRWRRGRVLRWVMAAGLLVPPLAVVAVATDTTYDGVICGSALSASLERPAHGLALDRAQEGCRVKGERTVVVAERVAAAGLGVAALCALGAAVPERRSWGASPAVG